MSSTRFTRNTMQPNIIAVPQLPSELEACRPLEILPDTNPTQSNPPDHNADCKRQISKLFEIKMKAEMQVTKHKQTNALAIDYDENRNLTLAKQIQVIGVGLSIISLGLAIGALVYYL